MPTAASECSGPGGRGQRAPGDQPGVRLDLHVRLVAVLVAGAGLVRVPGLGVDGGDHPLRGHLPGDPPAPVGAVGALGRFDVLAGHQRQQPDRLRRGRPEFLLGQVPQQPVRITDQGVDQPRPGVGVVPGDRRLARIVVVVARCSARRSPPRRRAPPGPPGGSPRSAG